MLHRAETTEKGVVARAVSRVGFGVVRLFGARLGLLLCGLGSEGGCDRVEVDEDRGPGGLEGRFSSPEVAALACSVAVDDESEQPLDSWPYAFEVLALGGVR